MANNDLDFEPIEKEQRVPRWQSREPDPTVQMSIRAHGSVYAKFRELCKKERRTNGDMLEVMMKFYLSNK